MGSPVRIARKVFFSSAHLYKVDNWDDQKNREVFGPCFSKYGHGHNYTLEAEFEGSIDPTTGLVVNLIDVDKILKSVIAPLDHKHLNFEVEYFKSKNPTTENIANYLFTEVKKHVSQLPVELKKVRLYEEEDLFVDVHA